jgi:Domain of unknown function (DUF1707)
VSSPPDLRASDAEREEAVARLRDHAAAGRLTVEELDERCAGAYASRTVGELAALFADLPAPEPPPPAAPAHRPALVRGYGTIPFTYEWELEVSPARAMTGALRHIAPALHRHGYELAEKREGRLVFAYSYRPGWTYAVAVLLFPVGLVALLARSEERITFDFDALPHGRTRVVAHGRAPRRVRRAFAELVVA